MNANSSSSTSNCSQECPYQAIGAQIWYLTSLWLISLSPWSFCSWVFSMSSTMVYGSCSFCILPQWFLSHMWPLSYSDLTSMRKLRPYFCISSQVACSSWSSLCFSTFQWRCMLETPCDGFSAFSLHSVWRMVFCFPLARLYCFRPESSWPHLKESLFQNESQKRLGPGKTWKVTQLSLSPTSLLASFYWHSLNSRCGSTSCGAQVLGVVHTVKEEMAQFW